MKSKLVEEIESRWEFKNRMMMNSVYITAAVLDPRFKQPSFLDDAKWNKAYTEVAQLADRTSALTAATGTDEPGGEEQHMSKKQKTDKEKEILMLLCGDEENLDSTESGVRSTEEIKNYLQDKPKLALDHWGGGKKPRHLPELGPRSKATALYPCNIHAFWMRFLQSRIYCQ